MTHQNSKTIFLVAFFCIAIKPFCSLCQKQDNTIILAMPYFLTDFKEAKNIKMLPYPGAADKDSMLLSFDVNDKKYKTLVLRQPSELPNYPFCYMKLQPTPEENKMFHDVPLFLRVLITPNEDTIDYHIRKFDGPTPEKILLDMFSEMKENIKNAKNRN